jgi:hypothetical protein
MSAILLALVLAGQPATPIANPALEKPRLICRESEEDTGSHIRVGRRCKTEDEWRRYDEEHGRIPASMRVTAGQGDALTPKQPPR